MGTGGAVSEVTTQFIDWDTWTFVQKYVWDDLGSLKAVIYPRLSGELGRKVKNKYTHGWLTAVYEPNGTNFLPNISYHANGMFSQINHSNGVSDSQSIAYGMMRPTRLKTLGNTGFSTGQISYDGAGNITSMVTPTRDSEFAYDEVSRLVRSEQHFSDGTWRNTTFSYDPYGNLTGRSGTDQTGSFSESFPVDSATNHLQGETYNYHGAQETRYDGDGNMSTTQWIDWDKYFEEVASVYGGGLNENYTYDADGERVIAGTWNSGYRYFLRDLDGKVLSEFEWSGDQMVWKKDYIYRGSQMAAVEDADDGLMYFHLDQLGTPRLITDANGVTVATHDYAPFGFEVSNAQADGVTKKFTGHERDGGDNPGTKYDLDYMHARYYSSWESRFLSVDPAQADPKNPQSWNRYSYVLGNPLKNVDPFGLIWNEGPQWGGSAAEGQICNAGSYGDPWCAAFTNANIFDSTVSENVGTFFTMFDAYKNGTDLDFFKAGTFGLSLHSAFLMKDAINGFDIDEVTVPGPWGSQAAAQRPGWNDPGAGLTGWADVAYKGAYGMAAVAAGGAAYLLGAEVAAAHGAFRLGATVAGRGKTYSLGIRSGARYYSEMFAREAFRNGVRSQYSWNSFTYTLENGANIGFNYIRRALVHFQPWI